MGGEKKVIKKNDLVELVIVFVFATLPFWVMAGNLKDLSEAKAEAFGLATVAAVVTIYRIWKGLHDKKNSE